jgi:exosortase
MLTRAEGQYLSFLSLLILSFLLFRGPLVILGGSLRDDDYSHVLFIPVISACLIYFRRKVVFQQLKYCIWGVPLVLLGIALSLIKQQLLFSDRNDYLSFSVFAMVFFWVAAFILCFGMKPLRAALFPLCFLVLMVPMPTILLEQAVGDLQKGSADTTHILFGILGIPAIWQGRVFFSLSGYRFEIAKECSGIHSCLVLFITSILVGHLFVRSLWARVCFSSLTILVAIFKNAVRIVTISGLTAYVDGTYYNGWLHLNGGVPFSLVAMAILVPSLLGLQKAETYAGRKRPKHKVMGNCASYSGIAER